MTLAAPSAPFAFGSFEDLPDDMAPDALPRDPDPTVPLAVPDQFRSEFRRMLAFIVDLFPQAVGSLAVPRPPRALFEDFFGSSSLPSSLFFVIGLSVLALHLRTRILVWLLLLLPVSLILLSFNLEIHCLRYMGSLRLVIRLRLILLCCLYSRVR